MTKSNVIKANQLIDSSETCCSHGKKYLCAACIVDKKINELSAGNIATDNVNQPAHYKVGGIETIDFMQAKLSKQQFEGYLAGNVIKYISRYQHKNGLEDLKKARWYLDRLIREGEQI